MAQHDFEIDNSTGQNVRIDINNVLKAILTNNSGTTDPSTVIASSVGSKAFSFWADTNSSPAVLKIRNSTDNGWIELFQLDGTLTLEDGSNSAPALAFRDDLDTGIYSSAPNTFNVATGGTERMELGTTTIFNEDGADVDFRIEGDSEANLFYVDAGNDRIGIGTSTPATQLEITDSADARITITSGNAISQSGINFSDNSGVDGIVTYDHNTRILHLGAGTSSFTDGDLNIDSSGRVLIGSTVNVSNGGIEGSLEVIGTGSDDSSMNLARFSADVNESFLCFSKSRSGTIGGNTVVQSGDRLGSIFFFGNDGTDNNSIGAAIRCEVDGTAGANDMPARLIFNTTPDGSETAITRMTIKNTGNIGIGTTDPNTKLHIQGSNNNGEFEALRLHNNNTGGQTTTSIGFTNTTQADYEHARIVATRDNSGRLDFQVGAQSHTVLCVDGFGSGVVGVNTVQAAKALDVNGEIRASSGILFGSDTAAANRLDDFEKGTFTPLLSDNISSGTANSYQNQSGHYTKIGNIVHIIGVLRANDISNLTLTNNACIRGLPFAVSDVSSGGGEPDQLHVPFINNLTSVTRGHIYGRMENGVSAAQLGYATSTGQNGANLLLNQFNFGGGSGAATFFSFSATYRTGS